MLYLVSLFFDNIHGCRMFFCLCFLVFFNMQVAMLLVSCLSHYFSCFRHPRLVAAAVGFSCIHFPNWVVVGTCKSLMISIVSLFCSMSMNAGH